MDRTAGHRQRPELVRHRAKLVAIRSGCNCQLYAVLDGCRIQVLISDLFADPGTLLLEHLDVPSAKRARVQAIRSCGYLGGKDACTHRHLMSFGKLFEGAPRAVVVHVAVHGRFDA